MKKVTREWVRKAQADYIVARMVLRGSKPSYDQLGREPRLSDGRSTSFGRLVASGGGDIPGGPTRTARQAQCGETGTYCLPDPSPRVAGVHGHRLRSRDTTLQ